MIVGLLGELLGRAGRAHRAGKDDCELLASTGLGTGNVGQMVVVGCLRLLRELVIRIGFHSCGSCKLKVIGRYHRQRARGREIAIV